MAKKPSPLHSLLDPFDASALPVGEFIGLGDAPLRRHHVAFLTKEPLSSETVVAHEHPIEHGPYCTQYVLHNTGGSFTGYLFDVKSSGLQLNADRMLVGADLDSMFASAVSNTNDAGVLLYSNSGGSVLAVPSEIQSRHTVEDE